MNIFKFFKKRETKNEENIRIVFEDLDYSRRPSQDYGYAQIDEIEHLYENAKITGDARIFGNALVKMKIDE